MKQQVGVIVITVLLAATIGATVRSRSAAVVDSINREALSTEINQFLSQQLATHIVAIPSLDKPPDRVLGAGTTGEFTWGTFMRAIGAYVEMSGQRQLAGKDLDIFAGQIGLLEHRLGGTRFSQLYAAQTLRHFGTTLKTNSLWKELSEQDRLKWGELLDPRKFYDPKTRNVINLPENYLGVAARLAAIDFKLGLLEDRKLLDDLLDRSAQQFTGGALFADDAPPTGRFDRYSNEYARFIWDAAETAQRADLLAALKPTLTHQMRLWWDLVKEDGYGYAWGRSLGVISYMDTLEIVAFVAQHPEFRPAPLPDLASAYLNAWRSLRRDYRDDAHLLSVFAKGRGNYRYITPEREWQQTVGFFGKLADAHMKLMPVLEREKVSNISTRLSLPDVSRFVFFRNGPRKAGVWLVRKGLLSFTLPITTGTHPGGSDYLPAPHGLAGFAAPVEQPYPSLVPYLELDGNRTIVASDGADEIEPSSDGRSLRVIWRRWAAIGTKPGSLIDPHITSEVVFRIDGSTLVREEKLTAEVPVTIHLWRFAVPTTAGNVNRSNDAQKWIRLETSDGILEVQPPVADWPLKEELVSIGDTALGRGPRLGVPLHLVYESRDIRLEPGRSVRWRIALRVATAVSQLGDRKIK
ncbi:MAG TPA: hypothetical protein VKN18_26130 [Blastocatellia bacterium]|nr:hypothetical protein [Blastocatellia bacterium]